MRTAQSPFLSNAGRTGLPVDQHDLLGRATAVRFADGGLARAMPRAIAVTALGLVVGCGGSDGGKPPANDDAGPSAQERANQRCVETFNSSESASSQEAFVDQIGPPGPPAVFVEYSPDSRVCLYTCKFPTGSVAQSAGGAEGGSVQPVPRGAGAPADPVSANPRLTSLRARSISGEHRKEGCAEGSISHAATSVSPRTPPERQGFGTYLAHDGRGWQVEVHVLLLSRPQGRRTRPLRRSRSI